MSCTEKCWTPIRCEAHGLAMNPWGRSVPLGYGHDCDYQGDNTRHLFDVHDSDRYYFDRAGWDAHYEACELCNPKDEAE